MQKIKSFLIVIVGFFVLITLVSLLMPSRVIIAHTIMINAPLQKIQPYLSDVNKWQEWNPILENKSLSVATATPGAEASIIWIDNNKTNSITLLKSNDSSIRFNQSREGENAIINDMAIHSYTDRNDMQLEWMSIHQLKWYPWEKFAGMFIDKATGPAYDSALNRIKRLAEQ